MIEWQPIETAPKGELILYFKKKVREGRQEETSLSPMIKVGRVADYPLRVPTHWMPLPEPPK